MLNLEVMLHTFYQGPGSERCDEKIDTEKRMATLAPRHHMLTTINKV